MKLKNLIIALLILLFLNGFTCSSNKPSKKDILNTLSEKLAGDIEVIAVDIIAMENVGSKVEPRYMSRFVGKLKFLNQTYEKVDTIGGNINSDIVRLVVAQESVFEVYGKTTSVLRREKWFTELIELDSDIKRQGKLLEKFVNPVIEGSPEHKAALEKYDEWERVKAEKIANFAQSFSGKWEGTYHCSQRVILDISTTSSNMNAVFDFYPLKQTQQIKSGSFSLSGSFTEDGYFKLEPKSWINRPEGFNMVGMSGNISHSHTELNGSIIFSTNNCPYFKLYKK
jgi:hypothetical protein